MMTEVITAIYENGVLRPLQPLILQEQQTVQLQIITQSPAEETTQTEIETVIRQLIAADAITPPSGSAAEAPINEVELRRLAERLGSYLRQPASEMLLEDRGL